MPIDRLFVAYNLLLASVWLLDTPRDATAAAWIAAHLLAAASPWMPGTVGGLPGGRVAAATWRRVRGIYPMLLIPVFWSEIGLLRTVRGNAAHDALIGAADHWLFRRSLHAVWLPSMDTLWLSEPMYFVYLAYFAAVFLPPLVLAWRRRDRAATAVGLGLSTIYLGCFAVYVLFPVEGPRHATTIHVGPHMQGTLYGVVAALQASGNALGSAFPSSHVAGAVGVALLAWRWLPRWLAVLLTAEGLGVAMATVYTQNHYALDALAGATWALVAVLAVAPSIERLGPPNQGALRARGDSGEATSSPVAVLAPAATTSYASGMTRPVRRSRRSDGPTALVTGATGFIGRHVVRRMVEAGLPVRALVRDAGKAARVLPPEAEIAVGDLSDPETVAAAVDGADTILHLGAVARARCSDPDEFRRVNVAAVDSLLGAASRHGVGTFVHVSTILTIPPFRAAPVNGASREPTPYEITKAAGERRVLEWGEHGGRVVIVHPTRVYGPGPLHDANGVTVMIDRYLRGPVAACFRGDEALSNYVHAADVADGVVRAARFGAHGAHYVLGGEENVAYRELLDLVGSISGVHRRVLAIPAEPIVALTGLNERLGRMGLDIPMTPGWVRVLLEDRRASIEPARRDLGYRPRPLAAGLHETIAWLRTREGGSR